MKCKAHLLTLLLVSYLLPAALHSKGYLKSMLAATKSV